MVQIYLILAGLIHSQSVLLYTKVFLHFFTEQINYLDRDENLVNVPVFGHPRNTEVSIDASTQTFKIELKQMTQCQVQGYLKHIKCCHALDTSTLVHMCKTCNSHCIALIAVRNRFKCQELDYLLCRPQFVVVFTSAIYLIKFSSQFFGFLLS